MQINVFSQTKESRVLVGKLWQEKEQYCFQYNPQYIKLKSAIPLGVEFPKYNAGIIRSENFFPSLADRIPSRQNPEYDNYCRQWDISPEEKDPFRLIATIGNRGPSSFIFRVVEDELLKGAELKSFRLKLGLSLREFALFIDTEPATLSRTETGQYTPKMLLRLCAMLISVPSALDYQLYLRGQFLHDDKIALIKNYIKAFK